MKAKKLILVVCVVLGAICCFAGCDFTKKPPAPPYDPELEISYAEDTYFKYYKDWSIAGIFAPPGVIYALTEEGKQQTVLQIPNHYLDNNGETVFIGHLGEPESKAAVNNYLESDKVERIYMPDWAIIGSKYALSKCPNLKVVILYGYPGTAYEFPKFNIENVPNDMFFCVRKIDYEKAINDNPDCTIVQPNVTYYKPEFMGIKFGKLILDKDLSNHYGVDTIPLEAFIDYVEPGNRIIKPLEFNIGDSIYHYRLNDEDKAKIDSYVLEGWYTEKELINKWDFERDTMPEGQLNLYAKYIQIK